MEKEIVYGIYTVDLPDPERLDGKTVKVAIDFTQEYYGADHNGKIGLISYHSL